MTNRARSPSRTSPRRLLARLLDEPSLVATVQSLPPRALGRLIDHIGLEDCGEIISLATTEQIRRIFDDDLWTSARPGQDEAFDADRFALWLEVMLEVGEDFAAEKMMELPEDLVTLALHRHVLVLDLEDQIATEDDDDVERVDKALASCLCEEIDAYLVIARRHEGWDSIVAILVALDRRDHALLDRVLERCCFMSSEYIDDNGGLYQVLASEELLASDVAADREDRLAAEGFIAPSQAASFLSLCRSTPPRDAMAQPRDPVTRAYFRELTPAAAADRAGRATDASSDGGAELVRLLAELDLEELPRAPRPAFLLQAKRTKGGADFRSALAALHRRDPKAHALRMEEIAYLTNVLVAGCEVLGRRFRPFEAVAAAAAVCNLGLERLVEGAGEGATPREHAVAILAEEGADRVFRVGFGTLHHEVGLAACDALARALTTRARGVTEGELRGACERSARFIREKRAQGKPALVRGRLSDLGVDETTQAALDALVGECPILVTPLTGAGASAYRLDRDRQLIAGRADLERVRAFLETLDAKAAPRR